MASSTSITLFEQSIVAHGHVAQVMPNGQKNFGQAGLICMDLRLKIQGRFLGSFRQEPQI